MNCLASNVCCVRLHMLHFPSGAASQTLHVLLPSMQHKENIYEREYQRKHYSRDLIAFPLLWFKS